MKLRVEIILSAVIFLSACNLMTAKNNGSSPATSTAGAGNQPGFVATIVAQTLTAMQPTETLAPTSTDTPVSSALPGNEWVEHEIPLYGAKVSIPRDWQIEEVNRRPEPTDPTMYEIIGHDCADYAIESPDGLDILKVISYCGFSEGYWDSLPDGAATINPDAEDQITRFPYQGKAYMYAYLCAFHGQSMVFQDGQMGICAPPRFKFGNGGVYILFEYQGPPGQINGPLETVDQIVLSIATRNH